MDNRQQMLCTSLLVAAALLPQGATGRQLEGPATTPGLTELDEARVVGEKLSRIRREMTKAEDRFYALYNQLNTDDDFDIHCQLLQGWNTRLKQRVCEVQYVRKAQAGNAETWLDGLFFATGSAPAGEGMARASDGGGAGWRGTTPSQMMAMARGDEYRRTMLAVINTSPDLQRLAEQREKLGRDYEKERQRRFKGHHWRLEW